MNPNEIERLNLEHPDQTLLEESFKLFQEFNLVHPHLFSKTCFFISHSQKQQIIEAISLIESEIQGPSFQQAINFASPKNTSGFILGYDFHLTHEGPKLIEINTNPGGLLLNLELFRHQRKIEGPKTAPAFQLLNHQVVVDIFKKEWAEHFPNKKLTTIAIVDQNPKTQFLYPEFLLYQNILQEAGVNCLILDPMELNFETQLVDMVYNRLTDFYFEDQDHRDLKSAYESKQVLFSPSPKDHQLFARKSNLELLSRLQKLSKYIPQTLSITPDLWEDLWDNRKKFFFKPTHGFGSKATYRGDKLTHRVWEDIKQHSYVAQEYIPPSERVIEIEGEKKNLKADLRAFTYQGKILLLTSRLYSGQTTNFRTPGGGFAPVFVVED